MDSPRSGVCFRKKNHREIFIFREKWFCKKKSENVSTFCRVLIGKFFKPKQNRFWFENRFCFGLKIFPITTRQTVENNSDFFLQNHFSPRKINIFR